MQGLRTPRLPGTAPAQLWVEDTHSSSKSPECQPSTQCPTREDRGPGALKGELLGPCVCVTSSGLKAGSWAEAGLKPGASQLHKLRKHLLLGKVSGTEVSLQRGKSLR